MGAWGAGPFDNDGANEWLEEFESDPTGAVTAVLDALDEADDDDIEAELGEQVVAVAEAVATALGKPNPKLPTDVIDALSQQSMAVAELGDAQERASAGLDRVEAAGSELADRWARHGEASAQLKSWRASIEHVRRRLQ